ncbi:MAG: VOC family protein [Rikenellaceae bacterium]
MEITATLDHININVLDLNRSMEFYAKALGLKETRRITPEDGSFEIVYLGDGRASVVLELTWLRDRTEAYELGDNETHICYRVAEDYDKVREFHRSNGWVCYENTEMGLYFINDPDDYWIEILPMNF